MLYVFIDSLCSSVGERMIENLKTMVQFHAEAFFILLIKINYVQYFYKHKLKSIYINCIYFI
jgi:hypothetical protein